MSLTTLFTGGKKVQIIPREKNTLLEIDATPVITHERSANLSKSPIEDGSEISDHITLDNKKATLECVVTKNPFNFVSSAVSSVLSSTISNPIAAGLAASLGGLLLRDNERLENAFLFVNRLWENRIPFTVVTGLETYTNVVMTNLVISQTAKTKNALKFTAVFEQITIATTESSVLSSGILDDETAKRASEIVKTGQQIASEVEEPVAKKASSFLFKIAQLSGATNS